MVFADPLDEFVADIVAERIAAFQLNSVSIDRAWKTLNSRDAIPYRITWDHIANTIEDYYREMNLLAPRKKNKYDHYYLRKITQTPPERIGYEIR